MLPLKLKDFQIFSDFAPGYTTSAATINGDDAIELFQNSIVVDVFGNISEDGTGHPWEYLDGWAYRNDATGGLDTSTFMVSEWHYSGANALDGETVNLTADHPFPAGSFSPGAPPQPVPTPEPATIFLLSSGIAGLVSKRLRLKRGEK